MSLITKFIECVINYVHSKISHNFLLKYYEIVLLHIKKGLISCTYMWIVWNRRIMWNCLKICLWGTRLHCSPYKMKKFENEKDVYLKKEKQNVTFSWNYMMLGIFFSPVYFSLFFTTEKSLTEEYLTSHLHHFTSLSCSSTLCHRDPRKRLKTSRSSDIPRLAAALSVTSTQERSALRPGQHLMKSLMCHWQPATNSVCMWV